MTSIQRLTANQAGAYRQIRLESLREHPEMFDGDYEIERLQRLPYFRRELAITEVYGAIATPLAGIIGFTIRPEPKHAHKGLIWGMYVRPQYRGTGLGDRLLKYVIAEAIGRVEIIQLAVVHHNPAINLYHKNGFLEYGREERAVKIGNDYFDDIWMALPISS